MSPSMLAARLEVLKQRHKLMLARPPKPKRVRVPRPPGRTWSEEKQAQGLCMACGKEPLVSVRLGEKCRLKWNARMEARRRAAGKVPRPGWAPVRCTVCGEQGHNRKSWRHRA